MNYTITISEQTAREAWEKGPESLKEILLKELGAEFFEDTTKQISSFDDILAISGKTMDVIAGDDDTDDEIAYKQAKLIAEVYNEGEVLDPMNTLKYKYFPSFIILPGLGFGLSCVGFDRWGSHSHAGVHLSFANPKDAMDAGKKFPDIYARLLLAR